MAGSSVDFLEDPCPDMLAMTTRYTLSEDFLGILLAFLGVETVNQMNTERLDVAGWQRHSAKMDATSRPQQH